MGLPVVWQLPDTAGVLSRELWRTGGVVVGAEYRGGGRLSREGVDDYTAGVLACLAYWGVYRRPVEWATRSNPRLYGNDWLLASATGLFHAHCSLEDTVQRGQELATIRGLRGEPLATIRAENDGVVLGLRSKGRIVEGNWSVLIGTEMRKLEAQP
jgi:predicted deacylase